MVSKKTRIASLVAASGLVLGGITPPGYLAYGDLAITVPAGAVELQDYDLKVRLHPDFPQVVDYRLGDEQLAGRVGGALTSVRINGTAQNVTVADPVVSVDRKSATYALTFPNLAGVSLNVVATVTDATLRLELADLVDPDNRIDTVQIPSHDLVTLSAADDAAQLTSALVEAGAQDGGDRFEKLSATAAGAVQGSALVLANDSSLAAAFDTNAVDATANTRWQHQVRAAGADKLGSVWAGAWTGIGETANPYVEVKITADANGDTVIDWQDAAVASRDILEFGNAAEEVRNEVVARAAADGADAATIAAITERYSLATDNLGQRVVLTGVEDADGNAALTNVSDAGVALNTTFGYDLTGATIDAALAARYQEVWDTGPVNIDTLYFGEALEGATRQHVYSALQEQGWVVGTHPEINNAADSDVMRFIYNGMHDGWNADPILLGATMGGQDGSAELLDNVWETNLPSKFLQRSDIVKQTADTVTFDNGTVAKSGRIEFDGAVVYRDGAYLLPWCDGGTEWNDAGPKRLYHFNPAGGSSTWELTDTCKADVAGSSLTVFKLTDSGRVKIGEVTPANGSVTLNAQAGVAYVLYPTADAPSYENLPPADFTVEAASGTVGTPISIDASTTDPEDAALTYSATGLPAGLTINRATGIISGTPTAAATSTITVTATDPEGATATATFTLTVQEASAADTAAPVITPIASISGTVGTALNVAVKATDASSPLTYSATGLPAGVTINATTGVISGTPTAEGRYPVVVTVGDPSGNKSTATFTITVAERATPKPTPPARPKFVRTVPYTKPGNHVHNEREWRTNCEPYSQTERCRTEIWASVVKRTGNMYTIERGWAFNNLTYLPFMERDRWATNPLGGFGRVRFDDTFTGTDGSQWRTECDTTATGRNACRSYRMTTVYSATPRVGGGYTFGQSNQWVFNNIVMFGNYIP